jgi:hypothetical protein
MQKKDFDVNKFNKELGELLKKYNVVLGVNLEPANKLTKLLKKFISVKYEIVVINNNGN